MKRINLSKHLTGAPGPEPRVAERRLVLYVEDDLVNQEVAQARLGKSYDLILVGDDKAACAALIAHSSRLSMILMDIELKGSKLSGVELAALIRGKLDPRRIPPYGVAVPKLDVAIIFVTAYGKSYPRTDLLLAGGGEVIDKPINFVQLHTAMTREYLAKRH
jgi:CheY-like chemotaxis protein